jgi:hypothetical protein
MTESLPAFPELPSSPEAKLRWIAWGNEIARLERERAEQDAKRYRWLRDKANDVTTRGPIVVMADYHFNTTWQDVRYGESLDDAIDAAIRSQGEPT